MSGTSPSRSAKKSSAAEEHIRRVRRICLGLRGASEKLSHGEPAFFANKRMFAMISNNHHNDGHIAVWVPTAPGNQAALIHGAPEKFYRPPYVGVKGWIGIELPEVDEEELEFYLLEALRMIAPDKKAHA